MVVPKYYCSSFNYFGTWTLWNQIKMHYFLIDCELFIIKAILKYKYILFIRALSCSENIEYQQFMNLPIFLFIDIANRPY